MLVPGSNLLSWWQRERRRERNLHFSAENVFINNIKYQKCIIYLTIAGVLRNVKVEIQGENQKALLDPWSSVVGDLPARGYLATSRGISGCLACGVRRGGGAVLVCRGRAAATWHRTAPTPHKETSSPEGQQHEGKNPGPQHRPTGNAQ